MLIKKRAWRKMDRYYINCYHLSFNSINIIYKIRTARIFRKKTGIFLSGFLIPFLKIGHTFIVHFLIFE